MAAVAAEADAAAAPGGGGGELDTDLPKAVVRRIVKARLTQAAAAAGDASGKEFQVNKDALLAFAESAKVFISYVSSTAGDIAKESKRQTVSAEDVLTALSELEFPELVKPLREHLEAFKAQAKDKSKAKRADADASRKRKPADDAGDQQQKEGGEEGGEEDAAAADGDA